MWAERDNGSDIHWAKAKSYCENYREGGYTDWRMPTQDELAGLYDSSIPYKKLNGYRLTKLIDLPLKLIPQVKLEFCYFLFFNAHMLQALEESNLVNCAA
jgi:hypothetical protein